MVNKEIEDLIGNDPEEEKVKVFNEVNIVVKLKGQSGFGVICLHLLLLPLTT